MNGIEFHKTDEYMWAWGRKIHCWSKVRNELNGLRDVGYPVVYSENEDGTEGSPYMPRDFPIGEWKVTGLTFHPDQIRDHYLYPLFIKTNAHQTVRIWLQENGVYTRKTDEIIEDYGYGNHFSDSMTTLGCVRDEKEEDIRFVANQIRIFLQKNEVIPFIVLP